MTRLKNAALVVVIMLSSAMIWFGCTKEEDVIINIDTPSSCFKTQTREAYSNLLKESKVALLDSAVYFINCSDSAQTITYKWDFGDGTTSGEKNPVHRFSKRGKYQVTLVSINQNRAFDTARVVVTVILGQKNILTGKTINNAAIDIVETNSGFLLLGTSNDQKVYPHVYTTFLMKLDADMKSKDTKTFPQGTRFNAIAASHEGNFILTGTTSASTMNNELVLIDPEGKLLWSKVLGVAHSFLSASPTTDKGYILTGFKNIKVNNQERPQTLLVKTDALGNILWEKLMNQEIVMESAFNVVEEPDGYVIAGVKRRNENSLNYSYQDSLIITKINNNGKVTWKTTVEWAINEDNYWHTKIARMKNGNYNVINAITRGLYIFSPSGAFLDRRLVRYATHSQAITKAGNLAILQHGYGNGFQASALGLSPEGLQKWTSHLDGRQATENGSYMCCANSWPTAIHALKNGGSIMLANLVDPNIYKNIPVLLQLDENGQPM